MSGVNEGVAQDDEKARLIEHWQNEIRVLTQAIEEARTGKPGPPRSPVRGAFGKLQFWRKVRTRLALLAARTPLAPQTAWVLNTGMFDARAYKALAGLTGLSTAEAASHYATIGERQGLRPSRGFDPGVYAAAYPELLNSEMGLLVHYARHGAAEGRLGFFDTESYLRPGRRPLDPAKTNVLVVCHDASRTGAPILGWNLVRALADRHNVIAVLLQGGELVETFADDAAMVVGPLKRLAEQTAGLAVLVREIDRRHRIEFAIINSIESRPLLFGLSERYIPAVTLVHEFAPNVYPPGGMTAGLLMSTQVVFDAEIQRQAALDDWPGTTTQNQTVFHQGASEVPRTPPKAASPGRVAAVKPRPDVGRLVRGPGDRPVVLGLGTIAMRKGVDLFISIAQAVVAKLGPDAVRFVWIGDTPQPHPEGVYCDWIADQIKRGGLDRTIVLLDPVDDLTEAYAAAAVVVSPSRLDPFPNVAMDAALAGVPIICFDRANGFAEFLSTDEDTRRLVAPYLDVATAAERVVELLVDEERRLALGRRLKDLSTRDFAMSLYVERLRPVIAKAKAIVEQERLDTEFLMADDTFSSAVWLDLHEKKPRGEAIRFYVRKAASGQEANQYCRRPAHGFVPQTYAEHHPALQAVPFENPLAHWVRAGKPEGAWSHKVLVPAAEAARPPASTLRAALHIHLHYPELADEILRRLAVNASGLDLFVSTTSEDKVADLERRFKAYAKGPVTIEATPNRGRDIGPMLTLFADRLQDYAVVGHIHGKRSLALTSVGLSTDLGVQWHEFLLQHLVGDRFPMADLILQRFAADPDLGLVFPEDPNLTGWSLDRDIAMRIAARMDPAMIVPRFIDFPIGTMFWTRPKALKPLFGLKLDWADYPEEPVPIDGTMLHAIERLLPVVCRHTGHRYEATHIPGIGR